MIQGGDFINHDGTGKASIYGDSGFPDENLVSHQHDRPGMVGVQDHLLILVTVLFTSTLITSFSLLLHYSSIFKTYGLVVNGQFRT
jgi:peptidylprolyl isomerase